MKESDRLHKWYCELAAAAENSIGTEYEAYRWWLAEIAWRAYCRAVEREKRYGR